MWVTYCTTSIACLSMLEASFQECRRAMKRFWRMWPPHSILQLPCSSRDALRPKKHFFPTQSLEREGYKTVNKFFWTSLLSEVNPFRPITFGKSRRAVYQIRFSHSCVQGANRKSASSASSSHALSLIGWRRTLLCMLRGPKNVEVWGSLRRLCGVCAQWARGLSLRRVYPNEPRVREWSPFQVCDMWFCTI